MTDPNRYSKKEAQERFEKTLRGAIATPPKPYTPKAKGKPSPDKNKAKKGTRTV